MSVNSKISQHHEADLAEMFGGRRTRGSGNQAHNPMDGRNDRYSQPIAFAWDGKATRGASIGVSRVMWEKAVEQSLGERPMLALRFYTTDRCAYDIDLAVMQTDDVVEMLDLIERQGRMIEALRAGQTHGGTEIEDEFDVQGGADFGPQG